MNGHRLGCQFDSPYHTEPPGFGQRVVCLSMAGTRQVLPSAATESNRAHSSGMRDMTDNPVPGRSYCTTGQVQRVRGNPPAAYLLPQSLQQRRSCRRWAHCNARIPVSSRPSSSARRQSAATTGRPGCLPCGRRLMTDFKRPKAYGIGRQRIQRLGVSGIEATKQTRRCRAGACAAALASRRQGGIVGTQTGRCSRAARANAPVAHGRIVYQL